MFLKRVPYQPPEISGIIDDQESHHCLVVHNNPASNRFA
jgi:hypothetical protein